PQVERRTLRTGTLVVTTVVAVLVAAALAFAAVALRTAQREHDTAERWRTRSIEQDAAIAGSLQREAAAVDAAAANAAARDQLRGELEAARARIGALDQELVTTRAALA